MIVVVDLYVVPSIMFRRIIAILFCYFLSTYRLMRFCYIVEVHYHYLDIVVL